MFGMLLFMSAAFFLHFRFQNLPEIREYLIPRRLWQSCMIYLLGAFEYTDFLRSESDHWAKTLMRLSDDVYLLATPSAIQDPELRVRRKRMGIWYLLRA